MKYELEIDWLLLRTCNFKCEYCFEYFASTRHEKLIQYATPQEWSDSFDALGKSCLIHITGGEPCLYPNFIELCSLLTKKNIVSINTNLSRLDFSAFSKQVDASKIHYINAALHYVERNRLGLMDEFLANARRLQDAGFNLIITCLMTPEVISKYQQIQDTLLEHGLVCTPKVVRQMFNGQFYPDAYTEQERILLKQYLKLGAEQYETLRIKMEESPTINMFSDVGFVEQGIIDYMGRPCGAGKRFITVDPDGVVHPCDTALKLGNVLKRDVVLNSEPCICSSAFCPYYCEKYTSSEYL